MIPRRADCAEEFIPARGALASVKTRTRACVHGMILFVCVLWSMADAAAVLTLRTGSHNGVPPFPRTNGRQIASNSKGIWFLAHDGAAGGRPTIHLSVSKAAEPEFAGDFHSSVEVAGGSSQSVLTGPFRGARTASLVIDNEDMLHLVFQSTDPQGIWYARCPVGDEDPSANLSQKKKWTRADGRTPGPERLDQGEGVQLGDLVSDAGGRPWVLYSQVVQTSSETIYAVQDKGQHYSRRARRPARQLWATSPRDGEWIRRRLTRPGDFGAPAADLDRFGTLHLTSSRAGSNHLFYLQFPNFVEDFQRQHDFASSVPWVPWNGTGFVSHSVIGWGRQALVAWEKVEHQILYAFFDGETWSVQGLHTGQEHTHHPILVRDQHDVGWVFWTNTTRSHTFYSRWLGSRFGAPYAGRTVGGDPVSHEEATRAPSLSHFHTVGKGRGRHAGTLGMALATRGRDGGVYFDVLKVPDLKPAPGRRVLFLDLKEVSILNGLKRSFHPMRKHPANPVLRRGPPGSWDDGRAIAYGEVLLDEGRFRMWYSGTDRDSLKTGTSGGYRVGYAESEDGIRWVKPVLDQVEYQGSTENNIVNLAYRPSGHWAMVVKDEQDPDPKKRYKALVDHSGGNRLHYSADGYRWTEGFWVNPDRLPGGGTNPGRFGDRRNLFYDELETDPERRWKVFGRHCFGSGLLSPRYTRRTCRYWSPDLIRWTADPQNPILQPRAGTEVEQHAMSVWVEGQVYLGLFDAWDALQLSPQQLAVSRDGRNFVHVCDGVPAVELGPPGSWDAGWISPVNLPVQVGDELWLYYSGGPVSIGPLHDWIDLPMETGLATIRRDGFVSLEVAEGKDSGWFDTIPLERVHSSLQLDLNAEGLSGGADQIAVELMDGQQVLATGAVLDQDGVAIPVRWSKGRQLRLPHSGTLRLRFRLSGQARLYGFTFR